jgi:hypothetical protein
MPSDVTPVDAFTTPVRKPLAGELVTQASIEQFVQPLADQAFNNKGRLDVFDTFVTKPTIGLQHTDSAAGAIVPAHAQIVGALGTSRYWLLRSFATSAPVIQVQRWYLDITSDEGSLVITTNAAWNAATGNWEKDSGGSAASKIVLGTNGPIAQHGISIQSVAPGQASPFSDGTWSSHAGLFYDGSEDISHLQLEGNLPTGETPEVNSLYGNSMCKCWGNITVTSGVIVVNDGFNVDAVATALDGTTDLRVEMHDGLANNNYSVVPGSFSITDYLTCQARANSNFDLRYVNTNTQAAVDLTANTRTFMFMVFGKN